MDMHVVNEVVLDNDGNEVEEAVADSVVHDEAIELGLKYFFYLH